MTTRHTEDSALHGNGEKSVGDVPADKPAAPGSLDHSSRDEFFAHYEEYSVSADRVKSFTNLRDSLLTVMSTSVLKSPFDILDVGCNAGTLSILWSDLGHRVSGIDVNKPLLDLADSRGKQAGHDIDFRLGTATDLPWDDGSFDICCVPELLEHVKEWEACLNEAIRVLRPGGLLYISTSSYLCPRQQEFTLPLYSWYPAPLKRHYERLAVTARPEIANHAVYPAVNWFSFYSLRRELAKRGLQSIDRFDIAYQTKASTLQKSILWAIRKMPPLRFLGHVATEGTRIVGFKL
tara:strand:+ start:1366 stop:2241 length:876 start_codon:yes stop_codon:yes gene_type:complete